MVDKRLAGTTLAVALAAAAAAATNPAYAAQTTAVDVDGRAVVKDVNGTGEATVSDVNGTGEATVKDVNGTGEATVKDVNGTGTGTGTGIGGLASNAWKSYSRSLGLSFSPPPLPDNAPSTNPFLRRGESTSLFLGVWQRVSPEVVDPDLVNAVQGTMKLQQDLKTIDRTVKANIDAGNTPLVNAYASQVDPRFGKAVEATHALPGYYSVVEVRQLVVCDLEKRKSGSPRGKPTSKDRCPQR